MWGASTQSSSARHSVCVRSWAEHCRHDKRLPSVQILVVVSVSTRCLFRWRKVVGIIPGATAELPAGRLAHTISTRPPPKRQKTTRQIIQKCTRSVSLARRMARRCPGPLPPPPSSAVLTALMVVYLAMRRTTARFCSTSSRVGHMHSACGASRDGSTLEGLCRTCAGVDCKSCSVVSNGFLACCHLFADMRCPAMLPCPPAEHRQHEACGLAAAIVCLHSEGA